MQSFSAASAEKSQLWQLPEGDLARQWIIRFCGSKVKFYAGNIALNEISIYNFP